MLGFQKQTVPNPGPEVGFQTAEENVQNNESTSPLGATLPASIGNTDSSSSSPSDDKPAAIRDGTNLPSQNTSNGYGSNDYEHMAAQDIPIYGNDYLCRPKSPVINGKERSGSGTLAVKKVANSDYDEVADWTKNIKTIQENQYPDRNPTAKDRYPTARNQTYVNVTPTNTPELKPRVEKVSPPYDQARLYDTPQGTMVGTQAQSAVGPAVLPSEGPEIGRERQPTPPPAAHDRAEYVDMKGGTIKETRAEDTHTQTLVHTDGLYIEMRPFAEIRSFWEVATH